MREKYESLSLAALRDIAKARKLKGVSTMKKSELIELMLEQDEKDKAKEVKEEIKNEKAGVADIEQLDSGMVAHGIIEVLPDGYGFIRSDNYLPGENDVYVSPSQIRRFGLKTGDIISGNTRIKTQAEKFSALLYLTKINGVSPSEATKRANFEDMTPIFPNERLRLENGQSSTAMRIVDLLSPIGKGQRGMIVSPPKAGKTTLLKQVAQSVLKNNPEMHLLILLIDERPEEVTDIKEAITGENVEVIYSTFDELPEHHRRVSEMVIERAKRLVEHKKDVMILLDSITRLARAYNLTVPPSGRTLSGGLDPAALHMPKRIFGAARNMREGGSLTILATALVDTGSKMDDVIYEEFKGTGNASYSNIGLMLDKEAYRKTAEELLFNKKLPSVLPYSQSKFRVDKNTTDSEIMMTAIGQGKTQISPYHMTLISAAIANGGTLMKPYLVDHTENYTGTTVKKNVPEIYETLMTSEEAAKLKEYMEGVIDHGTGTALSGESYTVAGKTGTAEYSSDKEKSHSWFTGFTNVDNPELVISAVVESADNSGMSAVSVAKQVLNAYYY